MSGQERYSLKWIAGQVASGPFQLDLYRETLNSIGTLSWLLLVIVVRSLMLVLFPVSVPFMFAFFRVMGPINERRRKARVAKRMAEFEKRRDAMDDDV
jgi:hypothetical protein